MRFLSTLKNDVHYQINYGFYFLYLFFSVLYMVALSFCPQEYKYIVTLLIILSDPAMLGSFFIGGIWLLEKREGLHGYWEVSPLRPIEYIGAKAVSLAIISVVSAIGIVVVSVQGSIHYIVLATSVGMGAMIFTTLGLVVASYAQSVNNYMLLVTPLSLCIVLAPILSVVQVTHPILNILPSMAVWQILQYAIGMDVGNIVWQYVILGIWLCIVLWLACRRIPKAMQENRSEVR